MTKSADIREAVGTKPRCKAILMPGKRPCPEPVAASDGYCEKHSPELEKKRLKWLLEELARYRWED